MTGEPDPAVNDNVYRSDVYRSDVYRSEADCQFELDEYDRVPMHRDGDCRIIGRTDYIKTEMWRFLRTILAKPF
jgi:hypothetical protein